MNLKGLFQRLKLPRKAGKNASKPSGIRTVRRYSLEFANIENSPSYTLETALSVGSEVGDIVIEDETLSPRHATFTLEDDVVTVLDHGSAQGTIIGDHQLTKGKAVILQPDDELMLGQIQVILRVVEEEVEEETPETQEEEPAIHESEEIAEVKLHESDEVESSEDVVRPEDKIKKRLEEIRAKNKGQGSAHKVIGGGSNKAANTLPRVMGAFIDVLLVMSVWHVFSAFTEFRELLEIVPRALQDYVLPEIEKLIVDQGQGPLYQSSLKSFLELVSDAERDLSLSYIISLYFSFRILTTLLFGVTLGSWFAGVRAFGNVIWKRLGGVIREVLAWILTPLILTDITTLFSRRSLKEMITFTHLYTPSKGVVMISWLLFIPLNVALFLVSPMFSGLEFPEPVLLQEVVGKKSPKPEEGIVLKNYSSHWFDVQFMLPDPAWKVLPRFSWTQEAKAKTLTPTLVFYHEKGTTIPLLLSKQFDWAKLLDTALAHNPFLQGNFPTLWGYVQGRKIKGASLQFNPTPSDRLKFQAELQELIKVSFGLSLENILEHVQTYGPLLRGLVEFRHALAQIVSVTDGSWQLMRFGKSHMLVYEVMGVKPFDLIIPLNLAEGRLFRVGYASAKERNNSVKMAKELWGRSLWDIEDDTNSEGLAHVIDVVATVAAGKACEPDDFEKVYGAYFEAAAFANSQGAESAIYKATIQSLKNMNEVLTRLELQKNLSVENAEGIKKLHEKLLEVQGQLESLNSSFFGVTEAPVPPVGK